jgi:putative ABC transport system permease protein
MDSIRQDIRFALRTMRRSRGFTAVAIVILALGVGAATTIFSVVNAVLLKPLPYFDPSRLVAITNVYRPDTLNRVNETVSLTDVWAWRDQSTSFAAMGAFFHTRLPIRVGEAAYYPNVVSMDADFLPTLGTLPAMGTNFEHGRAAAETVIISHEFWQRAFGGEPDVIGKTVYVGPELRSVRGVLAADFELPRPDAALYRGSVDLFLPAIEDFGRGGRIFYAIGRLAPGIGIDRAEAEMRSIDAAMRGQEQIEWSVRLAPLAEERTRAAKRPLTIFIAIGAVLLLIMCTNLVNLMLARNARRTQELLIRNALGATTGRLWRQQLTESLCLALLGCTLGTAIAAIAVRFISALLPLRLPITQGLTLDLRVLSFAAAVSAGAMIVISLPTLCANAAGVAAGPARPGVGLRARAFPRTQKALTVGQIGISIGLLAAASVLANSLWRLSTVERGFETAQVLGFQFNVPRAQDEIQRFVDRALDAIAAIPGVDSVGHITYLPPENWAGSFFLFRFDGPPPEGLEGRSTFANTMTTSPNYFETVGMTLIEGRRFEATDDANALSVMIVNQAFANAFLPQQDALGRRVISEFDVNVRREEVAREIVGVVSDTRDRSMRVAPAPTIYLPYGQGMLPYGAIAMLAQLPPSALMAEVRQRLGAINPDVPVADFQTLDQRIRESLREPRFNALLAAVCAALAVLFAGVGLYGVVAYSVSAHTTELGVRMALGSSRTRILALVLWQGAVLALIGAALGLFLAFLSMRGIASLLFEVSPLDPPALAVSVVFVVGVALIASFVPAWRACRLSPMTALRDE